MFGGGGGDPGSRLHAVLVKLAGAVPRREQHHLGDAQKRKPTAGVVTSKDIIESVLAESAPIPPAAQDGLWYDAYPFSEEGAVVQGLAKRLEDELRAAKRTHLSCTEVLLPCGLLQRIARDMVAMAESEPCGLRGCTLYLCYEVEGESEGEVCKGTTPCTRFECDPATASTFELYLTLRLASRGWNSFLPQFLRNLTKGGTVIVSSAYTLKKKKLYRSYTG